MTFAVKIEAHAAMKVLCIGLQLIQETSSKRKRKSNRFRKFNKEQSN